MRYKIEARTDFDIITPLYAKMDSTLTEQLNDLIDDSIENSRSLVIDFVHIEELNEEEVKVIERMHNELYQQNLSFVICHVNAACRKQIAELELEHVLNVTPTQIEAIDVVSMEGLERMLLDEGDDVN
ncbi:MAG: STAS domain-containing protein [Bacteroidetes bacterium]|nr:STAS domain-containing protein [Bacteroidota bacterium]